MAANVRGLRALCLRSRSYYSRNAGHRRFKLRVDRHYTVVGERHSAFEYYPRGRLNLNVENSLIRIGSPACVMTFIAVFLALELSDRAACAVHIDIELLSLIQSRCETWAIT